jgi:hypothetical protein
MIVLDEDLLFLLPWWTHLACLVLILQERVVPEVAVYFGLPDLLVAGVSLEV